MADRIRIDNAVFDGNSQALQTAIQALLQQPLSLEDNLTDTCSSAVLTSYITGANAFKSALQQYKTLLEKDYQVLQVIAENLKTADGA